MFGAKKKKSDDDDSKVMQKSSRGNMDEYEALRTIVAENVGLMSRVLDKIRVQRSMSAKPKKEGQIEENTSKKKAEK